MKKLLLLLLSVAILGVGASVLAATAPEKPFFTKVVAVKTYTDTEIIKIATDFIRDYLVDGAKVEVAVKSKNANVIDLGIRIEGGEEIHSAITTDGKNFYPTVINIPEYIEKNKPGVAEAKATAEVPKAVKPVVELFVMSHCPYGTQIEKGMIPVIETLGNAVDFRLMFVDYAMHGIKEGNEQMAQYCISRDQKTKLLPYLKCFLEAGDSATCLTKAKIDKTKLNSCVKATDAKFKITEGFNKQSDSGYPAFNIHKAENDKYGVQGSPSLVINGVQISSGRDSASLLRTICNTFSKAPAVCQTAKLSSTSPAPGFGSGASGGGSTEAQCN